MTRIDDLAGKQVSEDEMTLLGERSALGLGQHHEPPLVVAMGIRKSRVSLVQWAGVSATGKV